MFAKICAIVLLTSGRYVSPGPVYENNPFLQVPTTLGQPTQQLNQGSNQPNVYVVSPGNGQQVLQSSQFATASASSSTANHVHTTNCSSTNSLHAHNTQKPVTSAHTQQLTNSNSNEASVAQGVLNNGELNRKCLKSTGLFLGSSCNKFVSCLNGMATELNCPDGLVFNAQGLYCDRPENVQCDGQTSAAVTQAQEIFPNHSGTSPIHANLVHLSGVPHQVWQAAQVINASKTQSLGEQQQVLQQEGVQQLSQNIQQFLPHNSNAQQVHKQVHQQHQNQQFLHQQQQQYQQQQHQHQQHHNEQQYHNQQQHYYDKEHSSFSVQQQLLQNSQHKIPQSSTSNFNKLTNTQQLSTHDQQPHNQQYQQQYQQQQNQHQQNQINQQNFHKEDKHQQHEYQQQQHQQFNEQQHHEHKKQENQQNHYHKEQYHSQGNKLTNAQQQANKQDKLQHNQQLQLQQHEGNKLHHHQQNQSNQQNAHKEDKYQQHQHQQEQFNQQQQQYYEDKQQGQQQNQYHKEQYHSQENKLQQQQQNHQANQHQNIPHVHNIANDNVHQTNTLVSSGNQQHQLQHQQASQHVISLNSFLQMNQNSAQQGGPLSGVSALPAVDTNDISTSVGGSRCLTLRGQFPSNSCHKFLNCWAGIATEQACPDGLLFSTKGYCDYPENVNCAGRSLASPSVISGPVDGKSPQLSTVIVPSTNPTTNPSWVANPTTQSTPTAVTLPTVAAPELKSKCLSVRGQFPSTSCNKFVNCWDSVILEQECPEGFLFSTKGYCDYSHNVQCGDRPVDTRDTTSKNECPLENGTFRDRNKCNSYITCIANKVVARYECPEGFNYNDYIGVCDYSYRVDCSKEPLLIPGRSHVNSVPSLKRGDECPADFATYRDTRNCGIYYTCVSKKIVATYECPAGFSFNDDIGECDYAERVDCTKPPKIFQVPKQLPQMTNEIKQKIDTCTPGTMFPLNPQCTAVCLCKNGIAEVVQCPTGLAYDSKMDKCILPHLSRC